MPGPYSTGHSLSDARILAGNLGIRFEVSSISAAYETMLAGLAPLFAGTESGVAEKTSSRACADSPSWRFPTSSARWC